MIVSWAAGVGLISPRIRLFSGSVSFAISLSSGVVVARGVPQGRDGLGRQEWRKGRDGLYLFLPQSSHPVLPPPALPAFPARPALAAFPARPALPVPPCLSCPIRPQSLSTSATLHASATHPRGVGRRLPASNRSRSLTRCMRPYRAAEPKRLEHVRGATISSSGRTSQPNITEGPMSHAQTVPW